ncbi:MAG TPA: DUF222 domain-containing protein [Thermoanaerobaculia bacterium]|nr:DUF222 domain-containing protein [Thermoanaerobaculia bacterium]
MAVLQPTTHAVTGVTPRQALTPTLSRFAGEGAAARPSELSGVERAWGAARASGHAHSSTFAAARASSSARIDQLGDEIAELAAHIGAATHRLLVLLREFDGREGWSSGFRSCAHGLSWRTGIDLGAAREKVRVARALGDLPLISEAMRCGELSFSKVRALTRVAAAATEEELLHFARAGTASHVEKLVRAWRRCKRLEEIERANESHEQRSLQYHFDEDGMLVLRCRLDPEVGELLVRALEAAQEELYRRQSVPDPADPAEPPSAEQRRADALALLAESALGGGLAAVSAGQHRTADRHQVVVHVESLDEETCDGGVLECGERVSAETCRRLACDAGTVTMVEGASGEILSVGRKTRTVPPAIRRALERRDRGCRFPGCTSRFCDAHHVEHWADGGATSLANLLLLCRRHHRAVHEEGFSVELLRNGEARFRRPDGRLLPVSPAPPPLPADPIGALGRRHQRDGLAIGPATGLPTWNGEPFELRFAVSAFLDLEGAAGRATRTGISIG